jgi:hypothetical protein
MLLPLRPWLKSVGRQAAPAGNFSLFLAISRYVSLFRPILTNFDLSKTERVVALPPLSISAFQLFSLSAFVGPSRTYLTLTRKKRAASAGEMVYGEVAVVTLV